MHFPIVSKKASIVSKKAKIVSKLGGRFGIFFFCSRRGKGESEAPGRGAGFGVLLKIGPGGRCIWVKWDRFGILGGFPNTSKN